MLARLIAVSCSLLLGAVSTVSAQSPPYPSKPVRIVVPFAAGGGTDVVARLLGERLQNELKQPFVIENVTGASGNVGSAAVARAAPDGYTLLLATLSSLIYNQYLYKDLGYESGALEPIAITSQSPVVLAVPGQSAIKTLPELVAALSANPDKHSFVSAGFGSVSHILGSYLVKIANADGVAHVPFSRGSGPAVNELVSGRPTFGMDAPLVYAQLVENGDLRALCIIGDKRAVSMPNVPTAPELGMPQFVGTTWNALLAPKGTPQPIIALLSSQVHAAMRDAKIKDTFGKLSADAMPDWSPAETAAFMERERVRWEPLVKAVAAQPPPQQKN